MERYIHLLNFMIQEHGLGDSPGQIYNCGELRLAGEIVVRNRLRSRYKHAPRIAAHSTQYMCVSASGRILLPFIVLPKLSETAIAESSCKNWVLETSFDSTMNEELFRKWFKKVFLPHCSYETKNKPVLIIMDNSSSVLTPDIVELAILNNVHFLYSPEQLKSKLQPLGYNIFDLLKQRMIDEIRRRHPSCEDIRACRCSQEDIPSVFGTAASLISATDIQTAFCETGIYPFNYDFLSSLAPANTSVYVYRVQDIVTMGTQQASHVNTLLGGAQTNAALEGPAVSRARTAGGSGTKTEENDSIKKEGEENMKTVGGASDVSDTEGGGCPLCGVLYSDREDWIACDQCDRWVCQQCSGVSLAAWRAVSQTKAQWICHSCTA
ncbi:uncharacterized protein LOC135462922 [Liolophura sinensis]|uniref:uncharacterized protein LOC135462922 n=1 Tax=Liolophura sinensis TaxID=3198878 RepID=UPI0031598227